VRAAHARTACIGGSAAPQEAVQALNHWNARQVEPRGGRRRACPSDVGGVIYDQQEGPQNKMVERRELWIKELNLSPRAG